MRVSAKTVNFSMHAHSDLCYPLALVVRRGGKRTLILALSCSSFRTFVSEPTLFFFFFFTYLDHSWKTSKTACSRRTHFYAMLTFTLGSRLQLAALWCLFSLSVLQSTLELKRASRPREGEVEAVNLAPRANLSISCLPVWVTIVSMFCAFF